MESAHRLADVSPSFEPHFPDLSHSLNGSVLMDAAWDEPLSRIISPEVGESKENEDGPSTCVEDVKEDAGEEDEDNVQDVTEVSTSIDWQSMSQSIDDNHFYWICLYGILCRCAVLN